MKSIDFCSAIDELETVKELKNRVIRDRLNMLTDSLGIQIDGSVVSVNSDESGINIVLCGCGCNAIDTLRLRTNKLENNTNDVNLSGNIGVPIYGKTRTLKLDFRNLYSINALNGIYGTRLFYINLECEIDGVIYRLLMRSFDKDALGREKIGFTMTRIDDGKEDSSTCLAPVFGFDEVIGFVEKFIDSPADLYDDVFRDIPHEQSRLSRKTPLLFQESGAYKKSND